MPETTLLEARLDEQFGKLEKAIEEFRESRMDAHHGRRERYPKYLALRERVRELVRPRVKTFLDHFAGQVEVRPAPDSETGEVTAEFTATLATVKMTFSADHDLEVTKLIVKYDLEILPIFIEFERHAELEVPLEGMDEAAVCAWFDERFVNFAKTWVEIQKNPYYQRDYIEVDPVAGMTVPVTFAKAELEWKGRKYYFISDETLAEFKRRKDIA